MVAHLVHMHRCPHTRTQTHTTHAHTCPENATLHSRTSILEKVLDMRNEQIQVMQESKEVRRIAVSGRKDGGAH